MPNDMSTLNAEGREIEQLADIIGPRIENIKNWSILVDVSDLIYYIGEHAHLTGIQRVQASFALAAHTTGGDSVKYISWNVKRQDFDLLDSGFLISVLQDLNLPEFERTTVFDNPNARDGILPGSKPLSQSLKKTKRIAIVLLGAAWVIQDYFIKILELKRRYGAPFFMTVHDLIPIYAAHTCDQNTTSSFARFFLSATYVVDHYICVSDNTRKDLLRYFDHLNLPPPSTSVIPSGYDTVARDESDEDMWKPVLGSDEPFVLFVSTIEGRKNHILAYKTWEKLAQTYENPPRLICVGRYGWRSEEFLQLFIASEGLGGRIEILSDVADGELEWLFANCLFTIYPSLYEGWGLPITESLARGKVCIASKTSSMPEAGGDLALYINPEDPEELGDTVRRLIDQPELLAEREAEIRDRFVPRPWDMVAQEYIETVAGFGARDDRKSYTPIELGREYVIRAVPAPIEVVGNLLKTTIDEAFRSPILGRPLALAQFYEGLNMRGGGEWMNPEHWGTWLGLGGGSLVFWWDGPRTELVLGLLQEALPIFAGKNVRIEINRRSLVYSAKPRNDSKDLRILEIPVQPGPNRMTINMELSSEDREHSRQVDARGLMWSVVALIFLEKNDLAGRLSLVESLVQKYIS